MEYALLGALVLGILLFTVGWLVVVVQGFQRHPLVGLFSLIPGVNLITLPSLWHRVSGWFITALVGLLITLGAWFGGADQYLANQLQAFGVHGSPTTPQPAASTPAPIPAQAPAPASVPATPPETRQAPASAASTKPATATPAPAANKPETPETTPLALPAQTAKPDTSVPVQAGQDAAIATSNAAKPQSEPVAETVPVLPPTQDLPGKALYRITFKSLPPGKLPEQIGQYIRATQTNGNQMEGKLLQASTTEIILESSQRDGQGKPVSHSIKLHELRDAALMVNDKDNN